MAQPAGPTVTPAGLGAALTRYRVMAWTVGVGLVLLVFVAVPLQLAGHPTLEHVVGALHGFLYIIYLFAALDLARRARFSLLQMAAMVGAGLVPILAFVIERRITARVTAGDVEPWRLPWSRAGGGAKPL